MSNRPVRTYKTGVSYGLQLAVWDNGDRESYTISKRYKTKDGDYKNTSSLSIQDLGALLTLCQRAISDADSAFAERSSEAPTQPPAQFNNDDLLF